MRVAFLSVLGIVLLAGCSTIPVPGFSESMPGTGEKLNKVIGVPGSTTTAQVDWESLLRDAAARKPASTIPVVTGESAAGAALRNLMGCDGELLYIPTLPIEASDYTRTKLVNGKPVLERVAFDTSKPKDVNKALPNLSMGIGVTELDAGAQVALFSSKVHHRQIVMDFAKSRIEAITDQSDKFYGWGRIGAGLRLIINLWTTDSSFDGSLLGLAAGVKGGTMRGRLSAETIGIDSPDVTLSMPWSADLSEGSIQKAIESMAVIKSRIHDSSGNTTLVPHVLARVSCSPRPVAAQ